MAQRQNPNQGQQKPQKVLCPLCPSHGRAQNPNPVAKDHPACLECLPVRELFAQVSVGPVLVVHTKTNYELKSQPFELIMGGQRRNSTPADFKSEGVAEIALSDEQSRRQIKVCISGYPETLQILNSTAAPQRRMTHKVFNEGEKVIIRVEITEDGEPAKGVLNYAVGRPISIEAAQVHELEILRREKEIKVSIWLSGQDSVTITIPAKRPSTAFKKRPPIPGAGFLKNLLRL